ncbi:methyltransferase domain-containing protein [Rhodobacteraceae bacterium 2CG4]|uniref:Methyltransferase domain-containing protein n=1 Tax=Halovulum marinum TaxID=2662447 RepID=A0A6L5Z368_9RHOB|nr:class I SAM-dependent methyltransferase [Halovulum marinum]MSU90977.1 methyltransferase domain-containing protein [Halovulum marinum]
MSPEPDPTLRRLLAELRATGGNRVLDIGCGAGALVRRLLAEGYDAAGIDPQAEPRDRARPGRVPGTLIRGVAEALPFAEGAFDAAVLLNALHHVPQPAMLPALREARRVLRPGGALLVVEPLAEGPFFAAMRPVEDETGIRAQALQALAAFAAQLGADLTRHERYDRASRFAGVAEFAAALLAVDPARAAAIDAHGPALERLFLAQAERTAGGYRLVQPLVLWAFRKP